MSGGQVGDVRIMVELPDSIPPYRAYTINLNGMIVNKSMRAKLAWIVRVLVRRLGADIILIQETHFKSTKDMKEAFFPYGGQLRGYSPSASRSKGVVAYIPPDSVLYNMVHNVENDLDGRWALMEIRAKEEMQQMLNVYAPSSSTQARETFFAGLQGKFDECPNLIVAGDWNYAPEAKDRVGMNGLVAPPPQPEAEDLLLELGLVDLF